MFSPLPAGVVVYDGNGVAAMLMMMMMLMMVAQGLSYFMGQQLAW